MKMPITQLSRPVGAELARSGSPDGTIAQISFTPAHPRTCTCP
jgi:hypothetical protein